MNKFIFFYFIVITNIQVFAQNQRFSYEYTFRPDTLDKQNVIKEIMNLDISKEGSNFYSNLLLDKDSIFNAQIEQGKKAGTIMLDARKIKKSEANFIVSKKGSGDSRIQYKVGLQSIGNTFVN